MGLLDFLIWGAVALVGAIIISEVVSYFLDVPSIRKILVQKRASGKLKSCVRQVAVQKNDGHKVSMATLENGAITNDKIELSSNSGVSSSVKEGMIIDLDV